jgi:hypothetical protein
MIQKEDRGDVIEHRMAVLLLSQSASTDTEKVATTALAGSSRSREG